MADSPELIDVLVALYLLTDGDIHDSVPDHQLRAKVNKSESEVQLAAATLVKQGLAEKVFVSEGVTWLGVTAKGARVATQPATLR